MKNFRDLKVWEKAHQLALASYRVTTGFPNEVTEVKRMLTSLIQKLKADR